MRSQKARVLCGICWFLAVGSCGRCCPCLSRSSAQITALEMDSALIHKRLSCICTGRPRVWGVTPRSHWHMKGGSQWTHTPVASTLNVTGLKSVLHSLLEALPELQPQLPRVAPCSLTHPQLALPSWFHLSTPHQASWGTSQINNLYPKRSAFEGT